MTSSGTRATIAAASLVLCVWTGSSAWAQGAASSGDVESLRRMMQEIISENQELKSRVRQLEEEMGKLKATVKPEPAAEAAKEAVKEPGKEAAKEPTPADRRVLDAVKDKVKIGGTVELDVKWTKNFDRVSESTIVLNTADFDFEVKPTDWITGTLGFTWDRDFNRVDVDEAYVTLGNTDAFPLFVTGGRITVPFGISTGSAVGDKLTLTDPLTIEIFETKEDSVLLGLERSGFRAGAYVFRGETNRGGGERHIEHYGGTLGYRHDLDSGAVDVGVDFINSVFDSNELSKEFPEALTASRYIPGLAAHVRFRWAGFSLVGEYNGGLRHIEFIRDGDPVRIQPEAWQVEAGYTMDILGRPTYAAVGYSHSYELGGHFPKRRLLATVGRWIFDGVRIAFEYAHEDDYSVEDGGTGRKGHAVTSRLTLEF